MTGQIISLILLLPHYLQTRALSSSLLLSTPPPIDPPPPPLPTHTTEAVVLFEFTKKHDDELSLKMGDVITNVEQVCERYNLYCSQLPYMEQHNGDGNLTIKYYTPHDCE